MTKTTFSISYYCRNSKTNKQGLSPIEVCININQQRLFVNLPTKVSPKDFNKKRKPIYIEQLLNQYRVKVNETITALLSSNMPITATNVREWLKTGGTKTKTITDLTNEFMEQLKSKVNISITPKVYKKYELVKDFIIDNIGDKELCTLTNGDIIRLYDILKVKYLPSTSAGYMTRIKTMITYAVDNGYMKINVANNIKINKGTPNVKYLSNDDINKIKNLDLIDIERLDKVRDLMLFQCSVGMAYCDLVTFDSNNIEVVNGVPTYTNNRRKTGIEFSTVILPMGMDILKKYNGNLPLISNQKYNTYLKEIQKLAGIKTTITTHLCRKTFAHYMLNSGVRIETVARLLGHSNSNITQRIYCKQTTSTIASEVADILSKVS